LHVHNQETMESCLPKQTVMPTAGTNLIATQTGLIEIR